MDMKKASAATFVLPAMLAIAFTLLVQGLLVAHAFPFGEVLTGTPILGIDHPFHLYQIKVALALADLGRVTGYDPFFAGGYVGGVTFNASAKGPAAVAWLLQGVLPEIPAYKLYVATMAVIAPASIAVAALLARLRPRQVLLAGLFAIGLWWASYIHWYHTAGLASFVAVSFLAVPFCVLLDRLIDAPRATGLVIAMGVMGAALFLMHPFFVIPVAFYGVLRLALDWPAVPLPRLVARFAIVGALILLPNLTWILAMRGQASIGPSQYSINYQMLVDSRMVWMELLGLDRDPAHGAKLNPVLFLLSLFALGRASGSLRTVALTMTATWFVLVLFAAFGAALPIIGPIQPNRFSATAYLFLVIPAAIGAGVAIDGVRTLRGLPRLVVAACLGLAALGSVAVADEVRREVSYAPHGRYGAAPPEANGLGPKGRAVLAWLQTDTRPEGRVLFETSLGRIHDGGHIVGYLQMLSGREFVGGPYNNFFAGTRDGWMFGRPMNEIPPEAFLGYLRIYNIGWMVVHSKVAKQYLARFPGTIESTGTVEGLETFVVKQPLDFVESGHGKVTSATYGRLVVERTGDDHDPIVIRYHYVPGLRTVDGSELAPVTLMDDPEPFIKVTPRGRTVELVR